MSRETITFRDLLRRAERAHTCDVRWAEFWPEVAAAIRRMAPRNSRARQRLIDRLLATLVSGEDSGLEPPGNGDWELGEEEEIAPFTPARSFGGQGSANNASTMPAVASHPRETTRVAVPALHHLGAANRCTLPVDTRGRCQSQNSQQTQRLT
jgi:hypothetical protein